MEPSSALLAGLAAGLLIAMQIGPVSLLVVETAVAGGPRAGAAAGMGVATADLVFAVVAAAAGGAASAALAGNEEEIRVVAAAVLAAIAVSGLIGGSHEGAPREARAAGHYARFLAITMANPLTIASFAAVATALSLDGPVAAAAFAAGVGAASAGWHLALGGASGHAGRWITPRVRRILPIGGRIAILALAAHLAFGA